MNYIVLDLEWNQCPDGKEYADAALPFEIIEIVAVKLDQDLRMVDEFHEIIKPQVYKWIHAKTREVIHLNTKIWKTENLFQRQVRISSCGVETITAFVPGGRRI